MTGVTGDHVEVWDAGDHTVTIGRAALARFTAKVLTLAAKSVSEPEMAKSLMTGAEAVRGWQP